MSSRAIAFGGVVIDEGGRALLREPANHYDRYVWTFPKGRPNAGESPEETAIRETCEETGFVPEIVASIPGLSPAERPTMSTS
jgi:ADP-ribose pyrophosphatase YjhB (NUDIX family)